MNRTATALLNDRGVLRVAGPDARALLHNVLTLDMDGVDRHGSGYGALLTPQGKILWDFILHRMLDGYAADLRSDQMEAFAKRLSLYRLRAKVEIAPASELDVFVEWLIPSDAGEPKQSTRGYPRASAARPEHPGPEDPDSPNSSPGLWALGSSPRVTTAEEGVADPRLADLGHRWLAPVGSVATDATSADWHRHRIALTVPEGGVDFVFGDTFPHDAAMDSLHAIAFEKGCYIGQEVVSRMRHRGTARRRIVALTADGPLPEPGADILAGDRPLGRLGSSAEGRGIGLVRLDRVKEALDAGLVPSVEGQKMAVSLPAWATYGWPAEKVAAEV